MIQDVILKPLVAHNDDRGFFMEILRETDPFFTRFGQSSFSIMYPGAVKAWHHHRQQDDIWFFVSGMAQVGLYDLREGSPTFEETNTVYLGEHNRQVLFIPHGVAHGYRPIGTTPAALVYFTTHTYDPNDELRLDWNDTRIGFDWTTKNK
ncbi:MAG: dTDP-4-dehydrorhamnose 3,5-epimerase family protein [Chloroflexi bacterium]|nr:dTDP-4-dehydrorhamnose 3,5-epimerase family protein [Chloroflexota bacterium]